jgi:hypothetical protein
VASLEKRVGRSVFDPQASGALEKPIHR